MTANKKNRKAAVIEATYNYTNTQPANKTRRRKLTTLVPEART